MKGAVNCSDTELSSFLQVLGEGYLPDSGPGGSASARWRSMTIASKSYRNGKRTVSFHGSQFSLTYGNSTATHGEGLSMLSQGDSRVPTSHAPVEVPESPANNPGYGKSKSESFAKYDLNSHSWRTCQLCLDGELMLYSGTWPKRGMMRVGECWELPKLGHGTCGKESGLLPTLTTIDTGSRTNQSDSAGAKHRPTLGAMASKGLFPTLRAGDAKNNGYQYDGGDHSKPRLTLSGVVRLPTLTGSMVTTQDMEQARFAGNGGKRPSYPTLTANDGKNTGSASQQERNTKALNAIAGGALNPEWCEWFMGFPIGWSSIEPLPLARFEEWRDFRDWWGAEPDIPRIAPAGTKNRVARIRGLGNAQVPECAAEAWSMFHPGVAG